LQIKHVFPIVGDEPLQGLGVPLSPGPPETHRLVTIKAIYLLGAPKPHELLHALEPTLEPQTPEQRAKIQVHRWLRQPGILGAEKRQIEVRPPKGYQYSSRGNNRQGLFQVFSGHVGPVMRPVGQADYGHLPSLTVKAVGLYVQKEDPLTIGLI
jgi:hypothetical protein